MSLKKVCETRWECRIESLKAVRYQMAEIHEALLDMEENIDDPSLSSEAKSLSLILEDFSFILTLIIWYDLLFQVNIVSKSMQYGSIDLPLCNNLLQVCIRFVKDYRSSGYVSAMVTAKEIASVLGIEPRVKMHKRQRTKKRMFEYEGHDETPQEDEDCFRATVFYPLIDNMTTSLERRFRQLSKHNKTWSFLYNIKMLPEKEELLKLCNDLEHILNNNTESDNDGFQLSEELKYIQPTIVKDSVTPLEVLQHISQTDTVGLFPNVWVTLRIMLTIPITVASGERSFSKLKLIKTYLRSTMSEERLSSLAILSIENEMVESIDYTAAVQSFAAAKSRKVSFV
ncbi:52 kDa repressor of the inhibitor of the protein kinase-like [Pseudophryne corroboree]|uniref:52 kDa repressor of the inhibitor of the protein kinase-like n=1 Tax=Pseudophryne corroboree TaxID=495146 RepID=UPI003081FCF1